MGTMDIAQNAFSTLCVDHLASHFFRLGALSNTTVGRYRGLSFNISDINAPRNNFIVGNCDGFTQADLAECLPALIEKQLPISWMCGPMSETLEQTLLQFKFQPVAPVVGMYYRLAHALPSCNLPKDVTIDTVETPEDFYQWCQVVASVWDRKEVDVQRFFQGWQKPADRETTLLLAKHKHHTVGASCLFISGETAGCYWGSVVTAARGQRINTAMAVKRMQLAQQYGCNTMVVHCGPMSKNLYRRLGFIPCCNMATFRFDP